MKKGSNKKVLKSIVKECLLEILAEGLIGNNSATQKEVREFRGTLQETRERQQASEMIDQQTSKASSSRRPSYLDKIKMNVDTRRDTAPGLDNQTKKRVASITSDPIMSDILADTAMTTLQEQKETRRNTGPSVMSSGDKAAKIVDQSSPEDLFGGQANKWANLAFAPSIRK